MSQVTIEIPDNKMDFFMELVQTLGFKVGNDPTPILTKDQIRLVNEERKKIKENPEHFVDWEEARKSLKLD